MSDKQEKTFTQLQHEMGLNYTIIQRIHPNAKKLDVERRTPGTNRPNDRIFGTKPNVTPTRTCTFCMQNHRNYECPKFKQITIEKKYDMIRDKKLY